MQLQIKVFFFLAYVIPSSAHRAVGKTAAHGYGICHLCMSWEVLIVFLSHMNCCLGWSLVPY